MSSLLDSFSAVPIEIVRSLSARLGEPNDFIQKGLRTSAATMLGAIAIRSQEPVFVDQVTSMIVAFGTTEPVASSAAKADMAAGSAFLAVLFGSDRLLVERKIAEATRLGNASAAAILLSAAPLLLAALSPKVADSSLTQVVGEELPGFASLVPAGVPGQSRLARLAVRGIHSLGHPEEKPGRRWIWEVLLLGALLMAALLWQFHHGAAGGPMPTAQ